MVLVSLIIMPLNEADDKKYHAQKYKSFTCLQICGLDATFAASQVSWKKFPGIMFIDTGATATVYEKSGGNTR